MKKISFAILVFCMVQAAFAEQLTVTYVDGMLYLKSGSSWQELEAGDTVSDTAVIKLDAQSQAELAGKASKLLMTKAGTYQIQDLMKTARDVKQSGVGNLVANKLKSMGSSQGVAVPSTTAGVRASSVEPTGAQVSWATGDTSEYLKTGKDFLAKGKFEEAYQSFAEGFDMAMDADEETEMKFYMGYSQMLAGNTLQALKALTGVKPKKDAAYYTDYYILTGNLLVESLTFDDAAALLASYDPSAKTKTDEAYQTISYLEGYAYKMTGDKTKARKAFTRSYDLGKNTDIGKEAAKLMKE